MGVGSGVNLGVCVGLGITVGDGVALGVGDIAETTRAAFARVGSLRCESQGSKRD